MGLESARKDINLPAIGEGLNLISGRVVIGNRLSLVGPAG